MRGTHPRTKRYISQLKHTVVLKFLSILFTFLAVPATIDLVGTYTFGVWATIQSVISWIIFFDFGLANGLRNEVAKQYSKGNTSAAAKNIFAGYIAISLIAIPLCLLGTFLTLVIPLNSLFNAESIDSDRLRISVLATVVFVTANFILGIVNCLFSAIQQSDKLSLGQSISTGIYLVLIYHFQGRGQITIDTLAYIQGFSLLLGNAVLTLIFYWHHPSLRPALCMDSALIRRLITTGLDFFWLQLGTLVLYSSSRLIITHVSGPNSVTQFDLVFKLFTIPTFIFSLLHAPLWSAYTDAWHNNDAIWIRRTMRLSLAVFSVATLVAIGLALFSTPILRLWVGSRAEIDTGLVAAMALYCCISLWLNIFGTFLNGIGETRTQVACAIIAMSVNIPLAIFLGTMLGPTGAVLATSLSLLYSAIVLPIVSRKTIFRGSE
jgi:O-antigen/teichoic acid export membrane protein